MSSCGMARRLGWLLFILLAGWFLAVNVVEMLPATRASRDSFRELAARGVERTATVVSKRDERLPRYDGDEDWRFYVALEYEHEGRMHRRELPFHHAGLLRNAWERVTVGERVTIKAHPERPGDFYAPAFLEFGEALAPAEVNAVMYPLLGGTIAVLLGVLIWFKVLRRSPLPLGEGQGEGRRTGTPP